MTSMSDQELAETEVLLRQRLTQLAGHAPTAVRLPDEVAVVTAHRPSGRGRRFGVIAAVTALVGAGSFTTYSFLGASSDGGAATPQEAVTAFVSALEHEDILGMIGVTLPEEVSALRAAVDSISADAKRVDLLGDDFDAAGVKGLDVSVDGLALDANFFEGGLAAVSATAGTINASFDPKVFPFGDQLRAALDDSSEGGSLVVAFGDTDKAFEVMTVERDGRWYVSVEYTLAEYVRQLNGWEVPGPVSRTPVGFDSPEAAATGFYERLASLDLQSAIDTFAPGEDAMAWLAQSWMSDAQAAVEQGRANGWSVAVSGLTYDVLGDGNQLTLRPATFHVQGTSAAGYGQNFSNALNPSERSIIMAYDGSGYVILPAGEPLPATVDGLTFSPGFPEANENFNFTTSNEDGTVVQMDFAPEVTGEPQSFSVDRADGCTTLTGTIATSMFGTDPPPEATVVDDGFKLCGTGNEVLGGLTLLVSGTALQLPAISVVQSGGQWYVSPLGTILGSATVNLHEIGDGTSLFDTALAPFIYGGLSRSVLETMVKGQAESSIDPDCLPALTVEGGIVIGVVADPSVDAIRVCNGTVSFTSESSGSATATAVVSPEPTPAPEATTP